MLCQRGENIKNIITLGAWKVDKIRVKKLVNPDLNGFTSFVIYFFDQIVFK